ncbi:hypothetical protein PL11201_700006 [Planktothrix sp. PCC 11201]|nr:hypothetical protein PL11201_700006 [Planktothrix sp. PCC 11201]
MRGKDRKLLMFTHLKGQGPRLFPSPCGEKIENYLDTTKPSGDIKCSKCFRPLAGKR